MNSTTMPSEPKTDVLAWLADPALAVTHGFVSPDDMESASIAYRNFVGELEKEWPPERVKELALTQKREQYARGARHILDLELKNKDARAAGMSFKEREEKYAKKIRMGHRILHEYKAEGIAMKTQIFLAGQYVNPLDMELVKKEGFEKYVVSNRVFDYPQVPPQMLDFDQSN